MALKTWAHARAINEADVEELWKSFGNFDDDSNGEISPEELAQVMKDLGHTPNVFDLRALIKEVDTDGSGTISFDEFKALMLAQQGDTESRLKLAFSIFDEDSSGRITVEELRHVMGRFGLSEAELTTMINEVDLDGDGEIGFEEFCTLAQEQAAADHSESSFQAERVTSPAGAANIAASISGTMAADLALQSTASNPSQPLTATQQPSPSDSDRDAGENPEVERLKALLALHPREEKARGTSRLQMQIGLFRLLQGAAYRSFRESFSANHETHLQVRNLPYRITDFAHFVRTAISLYKGLGIVEPACEPLLDAVVDSVNQEVYQLEQRIESWPNIDKTAAMLEREQAMLSARSASGNAREKFAAGVEFAITMKKQKLQLADLVEGVLASHELNRLREQDLRQEFSPPPSHTDDDPKAYLQSWNRVILSHALETVDGAMMPVAYWYENFMPTLLAAFSVGTAADIERETVPDEAALDQWFAETKAAGEFAHYGEDVVANFSSCTPAQKLCIRQAWRLTNHYLNGVQKRRERLDFGRDSGVLSQYVAFIDVYLGRNDVRDAQMRVSFPYYIGPAVWRFFHTAAEIVAAQPLERQPALAEEFKNFFKLFATMYPCPYCRHHLNAYVVQNKEVEMYPVEYLLLGQDADPRSFLMSIDEKLAAVRDGASMRLFLWKLHNTVSSSIARSEEWYHRDDKAFYTTRYWPSIDSELARASALRQISIATHRLMAIYGLLKPVARLSSVRLQLQELLDQGDRSSLDAACALARQHIAALEQAMITGGFLQETYQFDPSLIDEAPHFTPEEEAFGRSNLFTEV